MHYGITNLKYPLIPETAAPIKTTVLPPSREESLPSCSMAE